MKLESVWSDLHGSTLALYVGRAGGHRWLVALPPEHAGAAADTLAALEGKGETVLLAYAGLTPLQAALHQQADPVLGRGLAGVVVVDRNLAGGPAAAVPGSETRTAPGGLSYREGGDFPAWTDALNTNGPHGKCAPASVCAGLGLAVRVCAPETLGAALLEWWAATPHALVATD